MQVEVTFKGTANEITGIMARLAGERIELVHSGEGITGHSGNGATDDSGKTRRHRRTKTEMEAARAAEASAGPGEASGDELEADGFATEGEGGNGGSDLDDLEDVGETTDEETDTDFSDLDDTPATPPAPKKSVPLVKLVSSKPVADKTKPVKPATAAKPVAGTAIGIDSHILPAMRAYANRKGGGTVGREAAAAVLAKFGVKTVRALPTDKLSEVYKLLQK